MRDGSTIMRERQSAIRREIDRRGIALKIISFDSHIPYSTLLSYFPDPLGAKQPAEIPSSAVFMLCGVLPDDLLNLLVPNGWALIRIPGGVDYDDISSECRTLLDIKERAHHPESEAGRDIGPTEQAELNAQIVRLRA